MKQKSFFKKLTSFIACLTILLTSVDVNNFIAYATTNAIDQDATIVGPNFVKDSLSWESGNTSCDRIVFKTNVETPVGSSLAADGGQTDMNIVSHGNLYGSYDIDSDTNISTLTLETTKSKIKLIGAYPGLFQNIEGVREIQGLENLDTSECTDMSAWFLGCLYLRPQNLNLKALDTSSCYNFDAMFYNTGSAIDEPDYSLTLDISSFDFSPKTLANGADKRTSVKDILPRTANTKYAKISLPRLYETNIFEETNSHQKWLDLDDNVWYYGLRYSPKRPLNLTCNFNSDDYPIYQINQKEKETPMIGVYSIKNAARAFIDDNNAPEEIKKIIFEVNSSNKSGILFCAQNVYERQEDPEMEKYGKAISEVLRQSVNSELYGEYDSASGTLTFRTSYPKIIVDDATVLFKDFINLETIEGLENLDFSTTYYFAQMFQNCYKLDINSLNFSTFANASNPFAPYMFDNTGREVSGEKTLNLLWLTGEQGSNCNVLAGIAPNITTIILPDKFVGSDCTVYNNALIFGTKSSPAKEYDGWYWYDETQKEYVGSFAKKSFAPGKHVLKSCRYREDFVKPVICVNNAIKEGNNNINIATMPVPLDQQLNEAVKHILNNRLKETDEQVTSVTVYITIYNMFNKVKWMTVTTNKNTYQIKLIEADEMIIYPDSNYGIKFDSNGNPVSMEDFVMNGAPTSALKATAENIMQISNNKLSATGSGLLSIAGVYEEQNEFKICYTEPLTEKIQSVGMVNKDNETRAYYRLADGNTYYTNFCTTTIDNNLPWSITAFQSNQILDLNNFFYDIYPAGLTISEIKNLEINVLKTREDVDKIYDEYNVEANSLCSTTQALLLTAIVSPDASKPSIHPFNLCVKESTKTHTVEYLSGFVYYNNITKECRIYVDLSDCDDKKLYVLDANQGFSGFNALKTIKGFENFDTSKCTDFAYMFPRTCEKLDLSKIDFSNLTISENARVDKMFDFNTIDKLDLSKATLETAGLFKHNVEVNELKLPVIKGSNNTKCYKKQYMHNAIAYAPDWKYEGIDANGNDVYIIDLDSYNLPNSPVTLKSISQDAALSPLTVNEPRLTKTDEYTKKLEDFNKITNQQGLGDIPLNRYNCGLGAELLLFDDEFFDINNPEEDGLQLTNTFDINETTYKEWFDEFKETINQGGIAASSVRLQIAEHIVDTSNSSGYFRYIPIDCVGMDMNSDDFAQIIGAMQIQAVITDVREQNGQMLLYAIFPIDYADQRSINLMNELNISLNDVTIEPNSTLYNSLASEGLENLKFKGTWIKTGIYNPATVDIEKEKREIVIQEPTYDKEGIKAILNDYDSTFEIVKINKLAEKPSTEKTDTSANENNNSKPSVENNTKTPVDNNTAKIDDPQSSTEKPDVSLDVKPKIPIKEFVDIIPTHVEDETSIEENVNNLTNVEFNIIKPINANNIGKNKTTSTDTKTLKDIDGNKPINDSSQKHIAANHKDNVNPKDTDTGKSANHSQGVEKNINWWWIILIIIACCIIIRRMVMYRKQKNSNE